MSGSRSWYEEVNDPLRAEIKTTESFPGWQKENAYNTRVLLKNWFEDRRQYEIPCSRCTGHSIYRTDYLAPCGNSSKCIPPPVYDVRAKDEGEGWMLLRNSEDFCSYLQNYTTTYDLMHNWEVRRAGVKPKPWRDWKLIYDARWVPDVENAVSFGNLTQLSYRRAPQLPLIPNDWDVYANNKTEYATQYFRPRYPDSYTLCRYAPPKTVSRETEDMMLTKTPFKSEDPFADYACSESVDNSSDCSGSYRRNTPRFNEKLTSGHMKRTVVPEQTLFPGRTKNPYDIVRRQPHPEPIPGCPILSPMSLSSEPVSCSDIKD